jgi:hypothetical protein
MVHRWTERAANPRAPHGDDPGAAGGSERGTLYAAENGFAGEPELQQVIDALRTAVRRHNSSFYK